MIKQTPTPGELEREGRAVKYHDEAKETLRACLDRLTELGFSIHEAGLPKTISNLLSKMED